MGQRLTLHPLDLVTNKLLAVVGRREPRDWVDILHCHRTVQPLGYLAWAASGKDPGLSPLSIVEEAARTRYTAAELAGLDFEGPPPDAAALSVQWRAAIAEARAIVALLPLEHVGQAVLDGAQLARTGAAELPGMLARLGFHEGRLRGAFFEVSAPR